MLNFWQSKDPKQLSDFVRELLDADLDLIHEIEDNVETEYIEPLFLEILWAEDKEKCVKRFYEFRARLRDGFLHEATELEWYVLMRLHHQWQEIREDLRKTATTAKDKAWFRHELKLLTEIEGHFDGDCEIVPVLFELYKARSPKLAHLGYVDLDRFMELMPRDVLQE